MDKVLLIDGLNYIYKSNIKFPIKEGKVSYNIVYNFFRSLRALIGSFNPTKVFFCLEGSNNFRYKIYSEYKANRIVKKASSNENFDDQRDIICNLLQFLSITTVYSDGFEADDIIATLSNSLKDEDTTIISSDTDFIQLLQNDLNVKLFNPIKKEYVTPPPYHYLVWKILRGDKKTDNIPGIVSDNEAIRLVENPKLLEEFLSTEENKSLFNLNKELIELKIVPDDELVFNVGNNNFPSLEDEFLKMEFNSMLVEKYWNTFKETFSSL